MVAHRFVVVCTIAIVVDLVESGLSICNDYECSDIFGIMFFIVDELNRLFHVSAVYFTYEFGYDAYLKVYGKLHSCCYEKVVSIHQYHSENYHRLN